MSGRPALDPHTYYGTDFDRDWEYTASEKAEILASLPVPSAMVDAELLWLMLGGIDGAVKGTATEIPAQEKLAAASKAGVEACKTLIAAIHSRQAEPEFQRCETRAPEDELTLEPLQAALSAYEFELECNLRVLAHLRSSAPPKNARPVADAIMKSAALTWEHFDLEVSESREFARFFEAVVKPKFRNPRVTRELQSAWAENKLKAFVVKWRKQARRR